MNKTSKQAKQPSTPDTPATKAGDIAKAKVDKLKKQSTFKNCPKCNRAYKKQETLDKHIESCNGRQQGIDGNGGAREGAGRPKGSESEKTKVLKAQKSAMQELIAARTNELLAAQFRQAIGTARLFMREKVPMGELKRGKAPRGNEQWTWKVSRVVNDDDFMIYLSLKHDAHGNAKDTTTGIEFYYMEGKGGNYLALANLLDRAYGRPKESMEVSEDPDAPLPRAGTGTTTELRKAFVALVKNQIKAPKEGEK
jgi:hypothetical protein